MRFTAQRSVILFFSWILVSVPSFASGASSDGLQVSNSDVTELEHVLQKNSLPADAQSPQQMEKLFRARSAAHRLRLSQTFLSLVEDPRFLQTFPEFKPLVQDSKRTVQALLEHDASKASPETAKAIRVLSLTQGINLRHPPDNLSAGDKDVILKTMKSAIHDLNLVDAAKMEEQYHLLSPSSAWSHLHESLTETIDFYDTYKSRQAELAKGGESLLPPSKWLEKLESENKSTSLSSQEKENSALKKRLALFLEKTDPLSQPQHFAKAEDFLGLPDRQFKPLLEKSFRSHADTLLSIGKFYSGEGLQLVTSAGVRLVKGSLVGVATGASIGYLIDPEKSTLTDALADATMSSITANCDSVNCQRFLSTCNRILTAGKAAKPWTQAQVLSDIRFHLCLEDFFRQPLDQQSDQRQDSNLDHLLAAFAPSVRNLTCSVNSKEAKVEILSPKKKVLSQRLVFDSKGVVAQVLRDEPQNAFQDRVLFESASAPVKEGAQENSKAQILQHCASSQNCDQKFDRRTVMSTQLYFWRNDRIPTPTQGGQIPLDSFRWAKQSIQLAETQGTAVSQCCQSLSCQNFFTSRAAQFSEAKSRLQRNSQNILTSQ